MHHLILVSESDSDPSLSLLFFLPSFLSCSIGAGTFGTVRAGIYKPKNGQPEVKCALKCLKPTEELPNQSVLV